MANSWNQSGTTWSQGDWGQQDITTVSITGLTTSTNVGSVNAFNEQGWGSDTYGTENWGQSGLTVDLTGFNFSIDLGELAYAAADDGWGRDEWGIGNWGQNTTSVLLDGLSMSAHLGPDGWGINSFGNGQWGGEFTFDVASIIVPTGQTLSAEVGAISPAFDMIFAISSPGAIGVGQGNLNVGNGADFTQGLASFAIPAAVGSISPADVVGLTGQVIKSEVNSNGVNTGDTTVFTLSSVTMSAEVGSISPADVVGISGVTFAADEGAISPINMTVGLTGQTITASLNTIGFGTIGYVDVDITGNTSYTDVNHAA